MKTYKINLIFTNFQNEIAVKAKNLSAAIQKAAEKALDIAPNYVGAEVISGGAR